MSDCQKEKNGLTYDDFINTRNAAEKGNPYAVFQMGFFYKFGVFVKQDEDEALKWFVEAGNRGIADAQWAAGDIYRYGTEKMSPNPELAARWFRYAAHTDPCGRNLRCYGECLEKGIGVLVDKTEAAEYYTRAVEADDSWAFFRLGVLYLRGDGVPQDVQKGLGYIYTAKMRGVDDAAKYWDRLDSAGLLRGVKISEKEVH